MRVAELDEQRQFVLAERPTGQPRGAEVLVEIAFCGICGSDLHMRDQPDVVPTGGVLGHEFSGRIAALGDDADEWQIGDRVVVIPYDYCGKCHYCLAGKENQCSVSGIHGPDIHGVHLQGGFADSVLTNAHRLRKLPAGVSGQHGALVEPLAVAVHGVERASAPSSTPVLVIGGGPIGLLVSLVLRSRGHRNLVLVDRNELRARTASGLGITALAGEATSERVKEALHGDSPTTVLDCSGSPAAIKFATEAVALQGRIVMIGESLKPVEFDSQTVIHREVEIHGSAGATKSDIDAALTLITSGELPLEHVITDVVPLSAVQSAFDALIDPATTNIKVLIEP